MNISSAHFHHSLLRKLGLRYILQSKIRLRIIDLSPKLDIVKILCTELFPNIFTISYLRSLLNELCYCCLENMQ